MVQIKDIYIPNAVCRPLTHNSFARGSNESPRLPNHYATRCLRPHVYGDISDRPAVPECQIEGPRQKQKKAIIQCEEKIEYPYCRFSLRSPLTHIIYGSDIQKTPLLCLSKRERTYLRHRKNRVIPLILYKNGSGCQFHLPIPF